MTAPVQLLTIGVEEPEVSDAVVAEFARLQDGGMVRVLDVMFVHHTADGDVDSIERTDSGRHEFDGSLLTGLLTGQSEGSPASDDMAWSIHDVLPRGQIAAQMCSTRTRAEPLVSSMMASGGRMFDEFWLSSEDRQVLDALMRARG